MASSGRTITINIVLDNAQAVSGMNQTGAAVDTLISKTDQLTKSNGALSLSFLRTIIEYRLVSSAYREITTAITDAISGSVQFEDTLNRIAVVGNLANDQVASIKTTMEGLGVSMGVPLNEISNTVLQMAEMGISGEKLATTIKSVTQVANALGESPTMTGEFFAQVGNAFNLTGEQFSHVADQIAYSTGQSAARINDLRTAFNYVGAVAADAGVSFSDLAATMGFLTNQGLRASTIGTGLRVVIQDLSTEGSKAAKAIGGTVGTGAGDLSLDQALQRLASLDLSNSDLVKLFNIRSIPVIDALTKSLPVLEQFQDATAKAPDEADRLGSGVSTSAAQGFSKLKNSLVELTDAVLGKQQDVADFFTTLALGIDKVASSLGKLSPYIGQTGGKNLVDWLAVKAGFPASWANEDDTKLPQQGPLQQPPNSILDSYLAPKGQQADNLPWTPDTDKIKAAIDLMKSQIAVQGEGGRNLNLDQATASLKAYMAQLTGFNDTKDNDTWVEAKKELEAISNLPLGNLKDQFEQIQSGILASEETGNLDGLKNYRTQLQGLIVTVSQLKTTDADKVLVSLQEALKGTDTGEIKIATNALQEYKAALTESETGGTYIPNNQKVSGIQNLIDQFQGQGGAGMDKVIAQMDKLKTSIDGVSKSDQSWDQQGQKAFDHFSTEAAKASTAAAYMNTFVGTLDKGVETLAQTFGDDLVNSLVRGKDAMSTFQDAFGDFAKAIISDLIAMMVKMLAFDAISAALGIFAPGAGQAAFSAIGTPAYFASGTDRIVNQPTLMMAGESGAERVTITPRSQVNQGGGSGGLHITIQGNVMNGEDFMQAINKAQARAGRRYV